MALVLEEVWVGEDVPVSTVDSMAFKTVRQCLRCHHERTCGQSSKGYIEYIERLLHVEHRRSGKKKQDIPKRFDKPSEV